MSTTLASFKLLVKSKLSYLNMSWIDLSSIGDGTSFDAYCQLYLSQWCREAEEIFAFKQSLTLSLADQQVSLLTTQRMHTVKDLFITSVKIEKLPFETLADKYPTMISASNGTPTAWSQLPNYSIIFNKPCTSGLTCYVSGWRDPAAITADTSTIEVPDAHVEGASTYVATQIAEPVANDAAGAARLERYRAKAMEALAMARAENRASFFGAMIPGG